MHNNVRSQVEIQVTFAFGMLLVLSFHPELSWRSLVVAISMGPGAKVRKVAGQGARRTGF